MTNALGGVRVLAFDVFGTVVDWRGSLIAMMGAFGTEHGVDADWTGLADAWRGAYLPSMNRVRTGARPWTNLDALHREALDELCPRFGLSALDETGRREFVLMWHRLTPWPDALPGLTRLRTRYTLATLSNGNVSLLVELAKRARLPWDCILSAELARHYKPDPDVYLTAARLLDCAPADVMMVAAHNEDLRAAAALGMRTAFVARPTEYGPNQTANFTADPSVDVSARDFIELANALEGAAGPTAVQTLRSDDNFER